MNIFSRLFKREPPKQTQVQAISIPTAQISSWSGNAYANDIYRAGVDAIARNAAKLKAVQVKPARKMEKILQESPNEYMTAYDFQYKLVTQYFLNNNAFALVDKSDTGELLGLYPINYSHVNFSMDSSGRLYAEFTFKNGRKAQFAYKDLIHLRRHFNGNEFLGEDNRALNPALELAHTQNEGLTAAIKNSATLRGILKFTQLLGDERKKELKENFVKDYLSVTNEGGVVAVDNQTEYLPIDQKAVTLDNAQVQATKEKIYSYLGLSEKIVNSTYDENEFAAFYESVIEPIATQASLEFTRKILSEKEKEAGSQIVFESGRLQFTSNKTKVELLKELLPLGLLSVNQGLEILNLPPIEGGDRRLQTLNVVDFDAATKYQLSKAGIKND